MLWRGILGVLGAAALLAGPPAASAQQLTKFDVLLAAPRFLESFAYYNVAEWKGYYKEEGLEVNFITGRGGTDVAKQVGAGNVLLGHSLPGNVIMVRSQGAPIKIVSLFGGHGLFFLMAPVESGIRSPRDLKGKRVGVMTFADGTFYELLAAMASVGLKREDADIQALGPGGIVQAMVTNKIDAISGVIEWGEGVETATGNKLIYEPLEKYVPLMSQVIIAHEPALKDKEKADLMRRFLRATMKGYRWYLANPDESARLHAERIPQYKDKGDRLAKIFRRLAAEVYSGQPDPGVTDGAKLDRLQKAYLDLGFIRQATPVENLYTNEFLK